MVKHGEAGAAALAGGRRPAAGGVPGTAGRATDRAARRAPDRPARRAVGGGGRGRRALGGAERPHAGSLRPGDGADRRRLRCGCRSRPGAMVGGHGDLWIGGQVDGRRRVTSEGSYPVIRVARVDPRRRAVTAVIDPAAAEQRQPPGQRPERRLGHRPGRGRPEPDLAGRPGDQPAARARPCGPGRSRWTIEAVDGAVWTANHDDGTLRRLNAATGALEGTVGLGVEPHGMTVAHGAVWVADAHHRAVLRVDPGTGRTVARIPVGFEPGPLAATRTAVWVATPPDPDLAGRFAGPDRPGRRPGGGHGRPRRPGDDAGRRRRPCVGRHHRPRRHPAAAPPDRRAHPACGFGSRIVWALPYVEPQVTRPRPPGASRCAGTEPTRLPTASPSGRCGASSA